MEQKKLPISELLILLVGEVVTAVLVILGYIISDALFSTGFDYRVITGAALGVTVTVLNYLFLIVSVNRAVNDYMTARGTKEMDDEEAARFANEHSMPIQNAIKTSYLVRTVTMLLTLVGAFTLSWFEPIATVIPLLLFRPIITLGEVVRNKIEQKKKSNEQNVKESD